MGSLTPPRLLLAGGGGGGGSAVGRGTKGATGSVKRGGVGAVQPKVKTVERNLAAAKRVVAQAKREFVKQRQEIAAGLYAEWNLLVRGN
jgi:hypothetical protein